MDKIRSFLDINNLESWALRIIPALLILVGAFILSRFLQSLLRRKFQKNNDGDKKALKAYSGFIKILILTLGISVALHTLGINMSGLFAAGGLTAVAFAFAMKNLSENLVSGMIIRMEGTIKKDDILEYGGGLAIVEHVGIRATTLRTKAEQNIIVPNAELNQHAITNYTFRNSLFRLNTQLYIEYKEDQKKVQSILTEAAGNIDWKAESKEPVVHLAEFGDSGILYSVYLWIETPWEGGHWNSVLNEVLLSALEDAGVSPAYPQIGIHKEISPKITLL